MIVYQCQLLYIPTWRASALTGGRGHLIFQNLIIHMPFFVSQRLNILVIKFKIMDLRSLYNNIANSTICLVWHFTHYSHMWKTLVWPHLWLRRRINLVEYLLQLINSPQFFFLFDSPLCSNTLHRKLSIVDHCFFIVVSSLYSLFFFVSRFLVTSFVSSSFS